jgi:sulfur-oxidizing protein SoxA
MFRRAAAALAVICAGSGLLAQAAETASPAADLKAFQAYFRAQFPRVPADDFVNGPYAVDMGMRKQWEEIMQFPPYEFAIDEGKQLFETPFKNGKTYADCLPNKGIGIRQDYPYFDAKTGEVVTLELAVNRCREMNGEAPLDYEEGDLASIVAYMAYTSRGRRFDIKIPNDPRALAAYENGKQYFYARRGQLNFSCASCHIQAAGKRMRGDILAPALGIMASFPLYRSEWGGMGTIPRRLTSCNVQTRAVPLKPDDKTYRDLEYFLTYLGNGLPVAGPGTRP